MQPELLLATNNKGKIAEYRELLCGCGYRLVTPAEKGISLEVEETGDTFAENAAIKAKAFAAASGVLTLADDSGLEVDALGGEPGVKSARYAGEHASDAQRVALLLKNMEPVPEKNRSARFRCVIVVSSPTGKTRSAEGAVEGMISLTPLGENGFGYDPVFFLPDRGKTMAELPSAEKNRISHRAIAARKVCKILKTA